MSDRAQHHSLPTIFLGSERHNYGAGAVLFSFRKALMLFATPEIAKTHNLPVLRVGPRHELGGDFLQLRKVAVVSSFERVNPFGFKLFDKRGFAVILFRAFTRDGDRNVTPTPPPPRQM